VAYSLCAACGAKTLVGATRCPRCQTPLVSYAAGAKRPETVRCPSCGILRPVAIGVCPNCHSGPEPPTRRSVRGLLIAGGAVVVILAVGFAVSKIVGPSEQSPVAASVAVPVVTSPTLPDREPVDSVAVPVVRADSTKSGAGIAPSHPAAVPANVVAPPSSDAPAMKTAVTVTPTPAVAPKSAAAAPREVAPTAPPIAPDSGWSYWRAITWVRLRDKPGRNGEEVRMIDSAQRIMLGPMTSGWRAARVGTDRGWVDPRLFVPAPKP
jgi:hypothetical protein